VDETCVFFYADFRIRCVATSRWCYGAIREDKTTRCM